MSRGGGDGSFLHLFLEIPKVVSFLEVIAHGVTSLLICISSDLVTNPQVWCVGARMEGPHDTKPDHLSEDLLLASLLGGGLGACRIRTSVPMVRPGLPRARGIPMLFSL